MSVKINSLEIENVKRIKAVKLEPSANGLTIIGGNNNQGKTSVLDAIAWALGGDKYKPTAAARDGAYTDPILHVELSNGLIVEQEQQSESHRSQRQQGRAAAAEFVSVCTGTGSAQVHERIGQGKSGDPAADHRRG